MALRLSEIIEEARLSARALKDYGGHFFNPTIRLGVTGLSRAGKTVFITALIHGLTRGGRFPVFEPFATGRIARARLEPQPDDAVPRFDYENHVRTLIEERRWPNSTVDISELRLVIDYQRQNGADRELTLDIVDYPGEWLLDLPLLSKTYAQWSADMLDAAASAARASLAADWRGFLTTVDPQATADEDVARRAAEIFTAYLRACREDRYALSTLPPGRFLMPGDLEGSPALTFAPLPVAGDIKSGSLAAMMERRYEAYKSHVVRPFFRDHFARIDRQIVLVDALAALNSGPEAVRDLENALADVLTAFRAGRSTLLSTIFRPRIDKILFAATKADHLHHTSHDRLESILRHLVGRAIARAENVGAAVDVVAMAAVRATREAAVQQGRQNLNAIVGTPLPGEEIGGEVFDGTGEVAIFPGELPADPRAVFRGETLAVSPGEADYRFVRFRPPLAELGTDGLPLPLPHIRLDRALEFLMGDKVR